MADDSNTFGTDNDGTFGVTSSSSDSDSDSDSDTDKADETETDSTTPADTDTTANSMSDDTAETAETAESSTTDTTADAAAKATTETDSQPAAGGPTPETEPGVENADLRDPSDVSNLALPVGDRTGETFHDLAVLEDQNHPLTPDITHDYIPRKIEGKKDLDVLSYAIAHPRFAALLEGETGTGKDFAIIKLAAETNRALARVNFGVGTTFDQLVGGYAPKDEGDAEIVQRVRTLEEQHDLDRGDAIELVSGASTQFEWDDGLLTWAVKNGGLFLADEINAAGGEATMPLHGVTEEEGNRYLTLEEKGEVLTDLPVTDAEIEAAADQHDLDLSHEREWAAHHARVAKWDDDEHYGKYIHPEFRFVGTMNPPKYQGSKELNTAFKQRFFTIPVDYLPPEGEKALLAQTTPYDPSKDEHKRAMTKLTDIAENLRNTYQQSQGNDLGTPIGHRLIMQVGIWMEKFGERRDGSIDVAEGTEQAAKFVLTSNAMKEDQAKIQKLIEATKFDTN